MEKDENKSASKKSIKLFQSQFVMPENRQNGEFNLNKYTKNKGKKVMFNEDEQTEELEDEDLCKELEMLI